MNISFAKSKRITAYCASWFLIALSFVVLRVDITPASTDFLKEWKSQDIQKLHWKPSDRFGVYSPGLFLEGAFLPFGANVPLITNGHARPTRYSVELEFATRGNSGWPPFFSLNFCTTHKWTLITDGNLKRTGVYAAVGGDAMQFVSRADYGDLIKKFSYNKTTPYTLAIQCDLDNQSADIYVDNKWYERINLRRLGSFANFYISIDSDCYLRRMKILDTSGKVFFAVDYMKRSAWKDFFLRKRTKISYMLLLLGCFAFMASSLIFRPKKMIFAFSALLLFCCGEASLRLIEKDNPYLNIRLLLNNPIWNIQHTTNLLGNYNEARTLYIGEGSYSVTKPKGLLRIVCLGSSSTQGHGIKDKNKVYAAFLENTINRNGTPCEVINAGLGGYETFRMSIFLKEVLVKLNPDIVTVYLANNDIFPASDYRVYYSQYPRMKTALSQNPEWVKSQRMLFMALEFRKPIKPVVYAYNYLCESYMFMYFNQARKNISAKARDFKKSFLLEEKKKIWEESLRGIIETCRLRGIKVLFIPEPRYPNYDSVGEYRVSMQTLARESTQVHYLDLREAYNKKAETFLFYDCVHPTEFGHEIIAAEIYNKLKSGKLLDNGYGIE